MERDKRLVLWYVFSGVTVTVVTAWLYAFEFI